MSVKDVKGVTGSMFSIETKSGIGRLWRQVSESTASTPEPRVVANPASLHYAGSSCRSVNAARTRASNKAQGIPSGSPFSRMDARLSPSGLPSSAQ